MSKKDYEDRIKCNNAYYDFFAPKVKVRSEDRDFSKAFDCFLSKLSLGKPVVDVGCGAGNHLAVFKAKNISCIGIEPSEEMRRIASESGKVIEGTFETLNDLNLENVGGIWAASSLLHVPNDQIAQVFQTIEMILPSGGPFYFTVRLGEGSKWDKWDDTEGDISRFLQLFNENDLLEKIHEAGFKIVMKWVEDSYWGRPSQWLSVIAQKT